MLKSIIIASKKNVKNYPNVVIEACVESVEEALIAENNGAHRIELCAELQLDGLTPSIELISSVLETLTIPIKVIIRNRAGGFIYSQAEWNAMIDSAKSIYDVGIRQFAIGALDENQSIDVGKITLFADSLPDAVLTIHKCIDDTVDPVKEAKRLKSISQVKYILTSGKSNAAWEGKAILKSMHDEVGKDLVIIAAGKVNKALIPELHRHTGITEYHGRKLKDKY